MRCDQTADLLPRYVGEDEPYPHELEVHLATCGACAAEERAYAGVIEATQAMRFDTEAPPHELRPLVMARLARPDLRLRGAARRVVHDPRPVYAATRYAAASLGGMVVGVAAIALIRRRGTRRTAA